MSKVYFTREITPESLVRIYDALGVRLKEKVAVKISSGEPGGEHYLHPELIGPLTQKLGGTLVECCTAYGGGRDKPRNHWKVIERHGFPAIAPFDLMDEEGEMKLPITGGSHMDGYNLVGDHLPRYSSMLLLSHFKGHVAGGFGGALKNMSIGVASRNGKAWIHSAGRTQSPAKCWALREDQDGFLECMAEACKSVRDFFGGENLAYINVANNLSIDCDCDSHPAPPEMADLGIFASLDPVALDRCCYDRVILSTDPGKTALVHRMEQRHAIHTVEWAEKIGMGSSEYEIVNLD